MILRLMAREVVGRRARLARISFLVQGADFVTFRLLYGFVWQFSMHSAAQSNVLCCAVVWK